MVLRPRFIMVLWDMNKLLALLCFFVFYSSSGSVYAGHDAMETLFQNGSLKLTAEPSCEPYQLAEYPERNSQTLAQDISWVLADMSGKPIHSESSCSDDSQGKKICKVIFSIAEGELEWARVYQFESFIGKKGRTQLKSLSCFNLP